ncbi:hypothetical protein Leryth_018309 [Lithospermum erythrorhizon]|nr:hypothetical protein Leryth_018309 [Lithospermum erythrorhizon]
MSSATTHSTSSLNIFPTSFTTPSSSNTPQPAEGIIPRPFGGTSSNSPACAVCKYRRRRCAPDCQLAPYFPADRQTEFLNAHKLYGVSNMLRVLDRIKDPSLKEIAMKTMIIQANARAHDPILGCCRMIESLQRQVVYYKKELDLVLHLLEVYRSQSLHEMQDYGTSYNNIMQEQFVGNGKGFMDVNSNNGRDYMDETDMRELRHKTDNHMQDLRDAFEHVNVGNGDGAGKFKGLQDPFRTKLVQGYMNNESSALNSHMKSKKKLTTAAPLFPMKELS